MQNHYDNEVESLLEKSIDENYHKQQKAVEINNKTNKCPFSANNKTWFKSSNNFRNKKLSRVEEKSKFNNMLLPEGWMRLFHESGMFFYCHVATKVVTWSMPYEILTEPARYHRVPVRSIPCLSSLAQKSSPEDWEKLIKPNKTKLNKPDHISDKVSKETTETPQSTDDITKDIEKEHPNVIKEFEEVKEEGEIESSDGNDSEDPTNTNEPTLPRQYQLNHHKSKNKRAKTVSLNDLNPNKRNINPDESDTSKRQKLSTNIIGSDLNQESEETIKAPPEPPVIEQLDYNSRLLEPQAFHKYCEKIFTFVDDVKYVPRFIFNKKKKQLVKSAQQAQSKGDQPNQTLAVETVVPITCTMKVKIPNKNLFIDLAGRNYSCILNMYCQNAYCLTPTFKSSSSMSGIHDFEVVCEINKSTYGVGEGRTKKIAKQKAILKTLEILIPGFSQRISEINNKGDTEENCIAGTSQFCSTSGSIPSDATDDIHSLFDIMEITDPRVYSYTTKLNSISPYNILTECINRHCVSDNEIKCKIEKQDNHNVFKLIIGDKEIETKCENKREGRQLAAQYMLAKLHPHIQSWGGILRLYGPGSKPVKRFDMQEMQNLLLEDRGGVKNNLINLLRKKMLELNDEFQGSTDTSKAKFRTSFQNIPVIIFHPDSKAHPSTH